VVASTGPFYNTYKFQPRRSSEEMLAAFDEDRERFLRALFSCAKKGKTWFTLDVQKTVEAIREPRSRVVAALNHLEETGDVALQVSGVRFGYRTVRLPHDIDSFASGLARRFIEAERRDVQRIDEVLRLATDEGCIVRKMLSYFGEDLGRACGHCDRCLGETIPDLPAPRRRDLGPAELDMLGSLKEEGHHALATPRQMARFLCGLTSPAASRSRPALSRHQCFGTLREVPFKQVLALAEEFAATELPPASTRSGPHA